MTDMVIPPEVVPFVAQNVVNQLGDLWEVPVDKRQATNDDADQFVTRLFNASTKALVETATRLATLLALEEAAKVADDLAAGVGNPEKPYNDAFIHACGVVARHIREIATKEPK